MESAKEKSLIAKTCEEEKTKNSNGEKEGDDDHAEIQKEDQLKSAKAKVGQIREENERLKLLLARMVKDYQSLQMHFSKILQQEEAKKCTDTSPTHHENEEPELVSLSLGRTSSEPKKDEKNNSNLSHGKENEKFQEGLALGLDCRFEFNSTEAEKNPSSENTFEELKEEPTEIWPPSKILKTMRSEDEEVLQQTNLKKARVSVRARCDTPTMNDGCQWRKYGQKIAKGNPCPRAYYRCTVSPSCPVRKQVQRWSEDMSILITTYEGTHNHPLPISATAMASTTSAAASMLKCHSSTSQPGLGTSVSATNSISTAANLHGLNFSFSDNERPNQFYFSNSSISTSNSHPTIVLDLTAPTAFSQFNKLTSAPRYNSPTCLNFSSPSSTNSLEPKTLQPSWNNGYSNYGTLSYNNNIHAGALNLGKQQPPQEHSYQPYMQVNNPTPSQQSLTETIAATTKVIASNPNFQSALAAAISSYIGDGGSKAQQNQGGGESSGLNLKWGESTLKPADTSAQNGIGCGSSFLHKLLSSNNLQQQGNMSVFPPNSLPFSTSKSASGSPDAKDHVK